MRQSTFDIGLDESQYSFYITRNYLRTYDSGLHYTENNEKLVSNLHDLYIDIIFFELDLIDD